MCCMQRLMMCAVALSALPWVALPRCADASPARAIETQQDYTPDTYAQAGQRVLLADGRRLNLRCSGDGTPAVILEAGGNADSSTWFRVRPLLAKHTKVCAYDRAGFGFSDAGPLPRDLDATVADLHALLQAANIGSPVVLVGHSLGSNIVRRYAQAYPQRVAGLVLVDPPEQAADARMPAAWQAEVADGLIRRDALLTTCEQAAAANDKDTLQQRCLRPPPPWMSAAVAEATRHNKSAPGYWLSLRSEMTSNTQVFSAPVPADENYGAIPLILLRPTLQDQDAPDEVRAVLQAARAETHARILAASRRSSVLEVANTSHDIQLDQPAAVAAAAKKLLDPPPAE